MTILRLDGSVVGPWVSELDRAWRSLAASLGSKRLLIDLRGVTYVDLDGRRTLTEIHKATGAEFKADTPMTQFFAAEARRGAKDGNEEA